MIVWLLVLLLLFSIAYVVYRVFFLKDKTSQKKENEPSYTLKI